MGTRKNKKPNKIFRKTRSKRQSGGVTVQEEKDKYLLDAVAIDDADKVGYALGAGANVNAKDNDGNTALILASGHYGHQTTEVVELLLKNGANVNYDDGGQQAHGPALLFAADRGLIEIMELLLDNNANVNSTDSANTTTLMIASGMGYYDIVKLLLKQPNINVNAKDKSGMNAIDWANESRIGTGDAPEIVALIEDYIKNIKNTKKNKAQTTENVKKYKRPNVSSLKTMAYHQGPSVLDTHINLSPGTIDRPYGKLGGKTRKNKRFRKTKHSNKSKRKSSKK